MNCINHPETPVSAYCQHCGKALCQECVRSIGGVVYCEACLAAHLANPGAATIGGKGKKPLYVGLPASGYPNPGLALALGFIPGVGAMYNGQFVKGLAHVFIFALLCTFSAHESFFGILIPFWIFYQVFDAYQTARARLMGTPLPNPFGLNDLGVRLGLQQHPDGSVPPAGMGAAPYTPPGGPTPPYAPGFVPGEPAAADWSAYVPPEQQTYTGGYATGFSAGFVSGAPAPGYTQSVDPNAPPPPYPPYPMPPYPMRARNDLPTGAIVLISLGVLFLLGSFGILHEDWIGRSWPLAIVAIGVFLLVRRTRETKGLPPAPPAPQAPAANERTSL